MLTIKKFFSQISHVFQEKAELKAKLMTVTGTVNKTILLVAIMLLASGFNWYLFSIKSDLLVPSLYIGLISGIVIALLTTFKKEWSPITAPLYAVSQGLAVSGVSILSARVNPGIIVPTLSLTVSVLAAMLLIYRLELVKVTEKFKIIMFSALLAVTITSFLSLILTFAGVNASLFSPSIVGIIFSIVVVGIAAFYLLVEFDLIVGGERDHQPKFMEWYFAFSLLLTLIWLYLEILRLLSKIANRR